MVVKINRVVGDAKFAALPAAFAHAKFKGIGFGFAGGKSRLCHCFCLFVYFEADAHLFGGGIAGIGEAKQHFVALLQSLYGSI